MQRYVSGMRKQDFHSLENLSFEKRNRPQNALWGRFWLVAKYKSLMAEKRTQSVIFQGRQGAF